MTLITADEVARAVAAAIPRLACCLSPDMAGALARARVAETDPRGAGALDVLCENARLAACEGLPLCQDTGTVRVTLEIGPGVTVAGDVFSAVDAAVADAYAAWGLRASVVRDALFDRTNTRTNAPAFCTVEPCAEPGVARLQVMLKGGGSDNACRVVMLSPAAGRAGIVDAVLACVREKAANACPPVVVGVGVGGTFESVAGLAGRALRRTVGEAAASADAAALEDELLARINACGIGPAAQGGDVTALAVHVETAPCHIASLPVAIELGCCALRRCTINLGEGGVGESEGGGGEGASREGGVGEGASREGALAEAGFAEAAAATLAALPRESLDTKAPCVDAAARAGHPRRLQLPLSAADVAVLSPGDACLLSGTLHTLRDAGHARLLAELDARGTDSPLPYGLDGATIFYAGPTPASPAHPERPFGAVGPTTASRMDAFAPRLYAAGVRATIGKGTRSEAVAHACAATGSVYFTAVGGAAALLGSRVDGAETVAFEDLGTEALRRIHVVDFPVTVAIDAQGRTRADMDAQQVAEAAQQTAQPAKPLTEGEVSQ